MRQQNTSVVGKQILAMRMSLATLLLYHNNARSQLEPCGLRMDEHSDETLSTPVMSLALLTSQIK